MFDEERVTVDDVKNVLDSDQSEHKKAKVIAGWMIRVPNQFWPAALSTRFMGKKRLYQLERMGLYMSREKDDQLVRTCGEYIVQVFEARKGNEHEPFRALGTTLSDRKTPK